ncbi:MAG: hypothetical protein WB245_03670 [Acidimicrobiia bacterium]
MSTAAVRPSRLRFSLGHLLLTLPWVALVIDAWSPIRDNSFLWHIRAGELQATAAQVLTTDPFSFTMLGHPWLTQSWLAELLYSWGESHWGLGFVPPMMLALSSITFLGLGLIAYRKSRSLGATAIVLLLSVFLLISFLVPRPVIFSFALFALVVVAWDRPSTRWTLPFLFWIWASVHGSFAIGLAYVGLTILAERDWKGLGTALVSGLATLLTAHGLGVIRFLLDFSAAGDSLPLLTEWRRPELFSPVFLPFVIGIGLILVGSARRLIEPRHLWLIVPFFALSLTATRAVPPAWIALVPLVGLSMTGLRFGEGRRFSRPSAAIFGLVVLLTPFLLISTPTLDEERFPLAAADALDDSRVFHDDRTGGYLIWRDGPDRLVYIDDRAELYGDRLKEFVDVRDGVIDWRPIFERDGIGQVLLPADEDLVTDLESAGWNPVYEDEFFVVLKPGPS